MLFLDPYFRENDTYFLSKMTTHQFIEKTQHDCIDNLCTQCSHIHMAFQIRFNEEKNQLLKATREISFENILEAIKEEKVLAAIAHPNIKHKHQRMYILAINDYAYVVPYVINDQKKEIFLKTLYASRVFTNKYLKKENV